ncbi:MAG TPA: 3-dehydroquinate synthase, partial [Balneolaceae bacterium]|nr:3-dehydroquinate synthase [Balneolaceae bacterium]
YTVQLGINLWQELIDYFSAHYSDRKVFIAIDSKVLSLHGQKIKEQCKRYFKSCHIISVPEGEESKSTEQWKRLQDELLSNAVERSTPLLAAGGGVTGDLAGFAAASALRGVPLIHIPTSLLAMVDSSIGGKTGINHPKGKNLIGAFYQPDAVFADLQFLKTLDRHEWIGGLAEMLKYAAIRKPAMFDELEEAVNEGFQPSERWLDLIHDSAAIKVDIVQKDEKESGIRAYLNFGHSFAHALEKLSGFGNISHGEAVFVGMIAATHYAGNFRSAIHKARFAPFKTLYDITLPSKNRIPDLIEAMRSDKKVKDETIRLVLLHDWGEPYLKPCEDESLLSDAWQAAFNEFN